VKADNKKMTEAAGGLLIVILALLAIAGLIRYGEGWTM